MIVGIDPGLKGAIAFLGQEDSLVTFDMPTFEVTVNRKVRNRIDTARLHSILCMFDTKHVFIEKVHAQPGNGAAAAFSFGFGCGILEGLVTACNLPYTYVSPQLWKRDTRTPKDKDGARQRASQLLPDHSEQWPLKKDDGKAEAALIALWGKYHS